MHKKRSVSALLLLSICTVSVVLAKAGAPRQQPSAPSGEISGRVAFRGDKPKLQAVDMSSDPVCASLQDETVYTQDAQVNDNATLPNAFIYIKSGTGNLAVPPPHNSVVITQEGCMYEPHVLGVMVGQPIQIVTPDPTTHNLHVTPKVNREWNVTQEPGAPSILKTFTQPEIMIPLHCNIHPWMKAYIGVVTNPYYAVTDKQGTFAIKAVPAGDYTIAVWTAAFGNQEQRVTVRSGETSSVTFAMEAR